MITFIRHFPLVVSVPAFRFRSVPVFLEFYLPVQKDGQVETNCKFLVKLILVTMQCNIFYHLSSFVYIASTHVQLAGCDNVKHIENECTKASAYIL